MTTLCFTDADWQPSCVGRWRSTVPGRGDGSSAAGLPADLLAHAGAGPAELPPQPHPQQCQLTQHLRRSLVFRQVGLNLLFFQSFACTVGGNLCKATTSIKVSAQGSSLKEYSKGFIL